MSKFQTVKTVASNAAKKVGKVALVAVACYASGMLAVAGERIRTEEEAKAAEEARLKAEAEASWFGWLPELPAMPELPSVRNPLYWEEPATTASK